MVGGTLQQSEQIKQSITLDEMKTLLIELGAQHIEDESTKGHIITNTICHNISDGKMKLYYYIEEKSFHCYTACGDSFDIYDLVIRNHKLKGIDFNFPMAVQWVAQKLGRKFSGSSKPVGFTIEHKGNPELDMMMRFSKKKKENPELRVFSERILTLFSDFHHPAFLHDNITHEAMCKYEIKYFPYGHKIIIPHRKWDTGELIGIKGRALNEHEIEAGYKYIPLKINEVQYNYPTYHNLYGLYQNKEVIKQLGKVVIFESEKSVLQCESYYLGNNFSVALSGSNISQTQVDMLLGLGINEVILALDKEYETLLDDEYTKYQTKMIRLANMFNKYCRVNVVFDKENYLGYKDSPSDKGKETLESLMKLKEPVILKV